MTKVNPFIVIENNSIKYPQCLEYLKECSEEEIVEAVDNVLKFIEEKKLYSMSRLYSLWNFIFSKSETPQTCSDCLIRKSQDLKKWREKQAEANRDVLGNSENLVEKAKQEPKKTSRAKRNED